MYIDASVQSDKGRIVTHLFVNNIFPYTVGPNILPTKNVVSHLLGEPPGEGLGLVADGPGLMADSLSLQPARSAAAVTDEVRLADCELSVSQGCPWGDRVALLNLLGGAMTELRLLMGNS